MYAPVGPEAVVIAVMLPEKSVASYGDDGSEVPDPEECGGSF